jgi:soluble lytic murein transglycosylase
MLATGILTGSSLLAQESQQPPDTEQLRQIFLDAQAATSRGRFQTANSLHQQLVDADYVLAPYVEMSIFIGQGIRADDNEILAFIEKHQGTWLAEKMRLNWLNSLKSDRKYQIYVDHFVLGTGNKVQQCFYLEALHRLGQIQEAYENAKDMWLVGESQPDQCDYVFDRWRRSDSFSEEYIWQRYILARREGEVRFSTYLANIARDDDIELRIRAYQTIRSTPEILENVESFVAGGVGYSSVIAQGLRNLAVKDLDSALLLWPQYRDASVLTAEDIDYTVAGLVEELIDSNRYLESYQFAVQNRPLLADEIFEEGAQEALALLDWQSLLDWLDLMPNQLQEIPKWTYWRARAMNQIGLSGDIFYDKIETRRDYYGFLASLIDDQPFSLSENFAAPYSPESVPPEYLADWQRAAELEHVEYFNNARLTWFHATNHLSREELLTASQWAAQEQLHYFSVQATVTAKAWDYLELRFPFSYPDAYLAASEEFDLPLSWIYAVSRQESSFSRDISSGAGARGLMQLMPATAREAARILGVRYQQDSLIVPEYNIRLGASYLERAYRQFDNNPIYASAAYNAGIARVNGWLRNSRDDMPLDVWVETIPFEETKSYVKNLMMFSAIYAAKLGEISLLEQLDSAIFLGSST